MNKKKLNNNSLKLKNLIEEKNIQDLKSFINDKNKYIQEIIRNTIISIKKYKTYEIFSNNDISLSINILNELYEKTKEIINKLNDTYNENEADKIIELLQKIIDKLSLIICGFGTAHIDDLLYIIFGSQYVNIKVENDIINDKYELIRKYIHPFGYKIIHWKNKTINKQDFNLCSNKLSDDIIIDIENSNMFECYDIESNIKVFHQKIYGIRVVIQNMKLQKTLIINGIIDDINLECFSNKYIDTRKKELYDSIEYLESNEKTIIKQIIDCLTFKEILIYGIEDIHRKSSKIKTEI